MPKSDFHLSEFLEKDGRHWFSVVEGGPSKLYRVVRSSGTDVGANVIAECPFESDAQYVVFSTILANMGTYDPENEQVAEMYWQAHRERLMIIRPSLH